MKKKINYEHEKAGGGMVPLTGETDWFPFSDEDSLSGACQYRQ